jgi:hypothetical protein
MRNHGFPSKQKRNKFAFYNVIIETKCSLKLPPDFYRHDFLKDCEDFVLRHKIFKSKTSFGGMINKNSEGGNSFLTISRKAVKVFIS